MEQGREKVINKRCNEREEYKERRRVNGLKGRQKKKRWKEKQRGEKDERRRKWCEETGREK